MGGIMAREPGEAWGVKDEHSRVDAEKRVSYTTGTHIWQILILDWNFNAGHILKEIY